MAKHKFTPTQRMALWEFYKGICLLCKKPIKLHELSVDHVIPEHLNSDKKKLNKVLDDYGLPRDFPIDAYENWVPAHGSCNHMKHDGVFRATPIIQVVLDDAIAYADAIRELESKLKSDKMVDRLIAKVIVGVDAGNIHPKDLQSLSDLLKTKFSFDLSDPYNDVSTHLRSKEWRVIGLQGEEAIVSNGTCSGVTSAHESPDVNFLCGNCHDYGPWNGVICLNCGAKSDCL